MATLTAQTKLLDKLLAEQKRLKAKLAQLTKRTLKDPEILVQFIAKSSKPQDNFPFYVYQNVIKKVTQGNNLDELGSFVNHFEETMFKHY